MAGYPVVLEWQMILPLSGLKVEACKSRMAGIEDEQAAMVICQVDSTSFDIWLNQNRQIVIPVCEIGFQRLYAIDSQKGVPG